MNKAFTQANDLRVVICFTFWQKKVVPMTGMSYKWSACKAVFYYWTFWGCKWDWVSAVMNYGAPYDVVQETELKFIPKTVRKCNICYSNDLVWSITSIWSIHVAEGNATPRGFNEYTCKTYCHNKTVFILIALHFTHLSHSLSCSLMPKYARNKFGRQHTVSHYMPHNDLLQ